MCASTTSGTVKSRARGLERAFMILDYLQATKKPQRPIEIANGMGAPKSSIYELVGILTTSGILERVDPEGRVFLGRKLHFWGLSYLENFDLTRLGQPILERITDQTRETSQLCTLDGNKYTVVMMNEGSRQFRISADVGEGLPIPWTASGRLFLGHMSDEEIRDFIPAEDFILPDGTQLEFDAFVRSVRSACGESFFAFDSLADTFTHCFAVPVLDAGGKCLCTLCIIAPKEDAKQNFEHYKSVLSNAAKRLSSELGHDILPGEQAAE